MKNKGYSVLEVFISLAIGLPIMAMAVYSLRQNSLMFTTLSLERRQSYVNLRTQSLVENILEELDKHRLKLPPRTHKQGKIFFTDGSLNPVSNRIDPIAPKASSNAITSVNLKIKASQSVIEKNIAAGHLSFSSCDKFPLSNEISDLSKYRAFLGIHPEGLIELNGKARYWKESSTAGRCWKLELVSSKSMIANSSNLEHAQNSLILIPIHSIYTLYLDQQNQLRYLSHRGERNIENQPILSWIENIYFNLTQIKDKGLIHLRTEIITPNQKNYIFFNTNLLSQSQHLNLLLN